MQQMSYSSVMKKVVQSLATHHRRVPNAMPSCMHRAVQLSRRNVHLDLKQFSSDDPSELPDLSRCPNNFLVAGSPEFVCGGMTLSDSWFFKVASTVCGSHVSSSF